MPLQCTHHAWGGGGQHGGRREGTAGRGTERSAGPHLAVAITLPVTVAVTLAIAITVAVAVFALGCRRLTVCLLYTSPSPRDS
ncbi:MAG: hypothetical protein QUU85_17910, partial [Candidatus Eisenbacteria bacterium]|nr:hypothetical protein [Candidatus Eisenbacteria bacterium]